MSNTGQPPEKPPMPEQPKTASLPAVTDRALLEDLGRNVHFIRLNVEGLTGEFKILQVDVRSLQQWRLDEERRRVEATDPPPAITSERARAIADGHVSQIDMRLQAAQSEQIVKDAERDRKIEETHALAEAAAATLKAQSDFMGMGKRGAQWAVSKEGRTFFAQLGAAAVVVYEFFKHLGVMK